VRQHLGVDEAMVGRETGGLGFESVERGPEGEIWFVRVRLRVPGLEASLRVSAHYASGFGDLVVFFRDLASDWRGWQGERVYESLEHDLRLTAVHDGHVRLTVQLEQTSVPGGWSAAAVLWLDPGEEMTVAAEGVAALMARSTIAGESCHACAETVSRWPPSIMALRIAPA
jgi:hypothetical protein